MELTKLILDLIRVILQIIVALMQLTGHAGLPELETRRS